MTTIQKKIIVDEDGNPQEVIISWKEFQKIEEALGMDLDEAAVEQLNEADKDLEEGNDDAFVSFDQIK